MRVREYLKRIKTLRRSVMLVKRSYHARTRAYPNWRQILNNDWAEWQQLLMQARQGPNVLFATSIGAFLPGSTLESLLSVALATRGVNPHVLLCDEILPACAECQMIWYKNDVDFIKNGPQKDLCRTCYEPAQRMYEGLGVNVHRLSNWITEEETESADEISRLIPFGDISTYVVDGLPIGEHAYAGALRFYARGTLTDEPHGETVLRRYLKAALLTLFAMRRLMMAFRYLSVVATHGIYVPHGIIAQVAREQGAKFIAWNIAYRKQRFIFSPEDTYHHTMMHEPTDKWENMFWSPETEASLLNYLQSRWHGTRDWIWFHDRPQADVSSIANEVGIDFSKTSIGLLTNVMWDAQLHYPANAFPNMLEWVLQTIAYFAKRPDLQLIIRVHPAEIRGSIPSRQPIVAEIQKAFPRLPKNIFVIPPESQVSTYATMLQCDSVLIYGTKTGVELTSLGVPVIVAGEAWIRNKGITIDANTKEDYFNHLGKLPLRKRMDEDKVQRARKYAYHFFFRRMIPLEFIVPQPDNAFYKVKLDGLDNLKEGWSMGLDTICDGIIYGTDFIYKEELINNIEPELSN